jgi:L-threonylcarbamoyladenylate synthase
MMDWSQHPKIQRAAESLMQGGVIAYPTEAVWGLGAAPDNEHAVLKILALKNRAEEKGLILVAADIEQFEPYLQGLSAEQRQPLTETWPGPNTWLVPHNGTAPDYIRGRFNSVALRVSAHPVVAGLCRAFGGPIVSTSANPQGMQPARQAFQVQRYFRGQLDDVAPGCVGKSANPTQIRDLLTGEILRAS